MQHADPHGLHQKVLYLATALQVQGILFTQTTQAKHAADAVTCSGP